MSCATHAVVAAWAEEEPYVKPEDRCYGMRPDGGARYSRHTVGTSPAHPEAQEKQETPGKGSYLLPLSASVCMLISKLEGILISTFEVCQLISLRFGVGRENSTTASSEISSVSDVDSRRRCCWHGGAGDEVLVVVRHMTTTASSACAVPVHLNCIM